MVSAIEDLIMTERGGVIAAAKPLRIEGFANCLGFLISIALVVKTASLDTLRSSECDWIAANFLQRKLIQTSKCRSENVPISFTF